jgi:hypothetical protein
MIQDYKNNNDELKVNQAIKFYIDEMVPKLKEIQQLKYDVNLIENETEGRDRRIILRATQYTDGDNLRIKHQPDENIPANFTLLPINQVLDKGEKASSEKFVQKINMECEILINEDDEIKIRVIDAGIFYKFTINETVLDEMPREEVLS